MIRKQIKKENVKKISDLGIHAAIEMYKEHKAALECNDGKPHTSVWEV